MPGVVPWLVLRALELQRKRWGSNHLNTGYTMTLIAHSLIDIGEADGTMSFSPISRHTTAIGADCS